MTDTPPMREQERQWARARNQGHSPGVSGTQRRGVATASHRAAKP